MKVIALSIGMITFIIVLAVVLLGLTGFLLYHFVISRRSYKKQLRDLERKYSYLDALLIGQDSQYIHRLEIISRTNLLFVEKYNMYSRRFKEVFDGDDKFAIRCIIGRMAGKEIIYDACHLLFVEGATLSHSIVQG